MMAENQNQAGRSSRADEGQQPDPKAVGELKADEMSTAGAIPPQAEGSVADDDIMNRVPHTNAAEEAEADTGPYTGAIHGEQGHIHSVPNKFQDEESGETES